LIRRRIPFDEDKFRGQLIPIALVRQTIDKSLHPKEQTAAMIVITGSDHERKIWKRTYHGSTGRIQRHHNFM